MCEAVQRAVAAGIIVVAAAGNYGMDVEGRTVYGSIATPGNDPHVITVGAVDTKQTAIRSDDRVARFSSRGPTRFDLVLKPDLVAPGTGVTSAEAAGSYLARTHPQRHVTGAGGNAYIQLSGTSMAASIVSGTVALLLERNPRLTVRAAKLVIQASSSLLGSEGLVACGAGILNALGATRLLGGALSQRRPPTTNISAEIVQASGIVFWGPVVSAGHLDDRSFSPTCPDNLEIVRSMRRVFLQDQHEAQSWRDPDAIHRSMQDTIYWGTGDTIYWGTADMLYWELRVPSIEER
jgi:subtilisin family serine protease